VRCADGHRKTEPGCNDNGVFRRFGPPASGEFCVSLAGGIIPGNFHPNSCCSAPARKKRTTIFKMCQLLADFLRKSIDLGAREYILNIAQREVMEPL
jgi:hypothetical protein